MLVGREAASADFWLAAALRTRTAGSPVLLPPERIVTRWQTLASVENVLLRGAGAGKTVLRIVDLPRTARVTGGIPGQAGARQLRCGDGLAACRLHDRKVASNRMLSVHALHDPTAEAMYWPRHREEIIRN